MKEKRSSKWFFALVIVLVAVFLSGLNFSPNTWLTGWDTLHPEFDLFLNLKRVLYGVWREEQGLGAVAGHSHMADLPRILLFYFFSLVFPPSFLRYLYFFLCLVLGPLGIYFFVKNSFFERDEGFNSRAASFLGALFYLLNLGTLQHFYVPFEMFATQYAFLPWLFWLVTDFLKFGRKKTLVWLIIINFLAAPMAYAATLWYVYFLVLVIYIFVFCFLKLGNIFRGLTVIFLILAINSFWLLPNLYFLKTSASIVPLAKINLLFSRRAFAEDAKYADFQNAAILKGFLFDWQEFKEGRFVNLLGEWRNHLKNPIVTIAGYVLVAVILEGLAVSIFKKTKINLVLLPVLGLALVFLVHNIAGLREIFLYLRSRLNIFEEGLRFPWTKFSLVVMFCYACFFAKGIKISLDLAKKKIFRLGIIFLFSGILFFWMKPAFEGELIDRSRRIVIPQEYFQLYNWFKNQSPNERIAFFPVYSFYGWQYYRWGFEGAGFNWFGLFQPYLDRDFDRWSPYNEQYYWEISYAVYSKNRELLESVLEKYDVQWLLVDENVINPSSSAVVNFEELESMLLSSPQIKFVKQLGKIKIYRFELKKPLSSFVFLAQNLPQISPSYFWTNLDKAYEKQGNYLSKSGVASGYRFIEKDDSIKNKKEILSDFYYPFRSLFTGRSLSELDFEINETETDFIFRKKLPAGVADYELKAPLETKELLWINPLKLSESHYLVPKIRRNKEILEVIIPKVGGYFSAQIEAVKDKNVLLAKNCNQFAFGKVENQPKGEFLRLSAVDAQNCSAVFNLENLLHKFSYLIKIEAQNVEGNSLLFWIENLTTRKPDAELYLPKAGGVFYFIQPPMAKDGLGYALHFDNISIGQQKTVNDLGKIRVNLIPYKFLTEIVLVPKNNYELAKTELFPVETGHPNSSLYQVSLKEVSSNSVLVLSQSFHSGWKAYLVNSNFQLTIFKQRIDLNWLLAPLTGKEIKDHVIVNNWENGWDLKNIKFQNSNSKIYLIFLPQYLQYLGFGILGVALVWMFASVKNPPKVSKQ